MFSVFHASAWANYLASFILGYLLGSIPFGMIFAYLAGAGDVRSIGSGNIGATNVLRTGNKWAAAATLLFDAGKGAAAAWFAAHLFGIGGAAVAALGAFFGHLFPVWLGFRGGKGVATFFGIALILNWIAGLCALAVWIVVAGISRLSSLSALVAVALTPLFMLVLHNNLFAALMALLALLVFLTHRANIERLLHGTEPRIGSADR